MTIIIHIIVQYPFTPPHCLGSLAGIIRWATYRSRMNMNKPSRGLQWTQIRKLWLTCIELQQPKIRWKTPSGDHFPYYHSKGHHSEDVIIRYNSSARILMLIRFLEVVRHSQWAWLIKIYRAETVNTYPLTISHALLENLPMLSPPMDSWIHGSSESWDIPQQWNHRFRVRAVSHVCRRFRPFCSSKQA